MGVQLDDVGDPLDVVGLPHADPAELVVTSVDDHDVCGGRLVVVVGLVGLADVDTGGGE